MGLKNSRLIDAVGSDPESEGMVFFIIDSWDWSDEHGHLFALQNKLNSYFSYFESGQIYKEHPNAEGRALRIELISRYPLPAAAVEILHNAKAVAENLAVSIQWNQNSAGTTA